MKKIVIALLMILVYWVAVFIVRKGFIFDDFVEGPFYLCLGEGLVRLGFYIGIVINALISLYICAKIHEDNAESVGDYYYEYRDGPGVGSFIAFFVLLWVVEVGVLFVLDKIFHLSDLVTSSTYIDHKMAWNIGLAALFHLICFLLILGGIRGRKRANRRDKDYKEKTVENRMDSTGGRVHSYEKVNDYEQKTAENDVDSISGMKERFDKIADESMRYRDMQ